MAREAPLRFICAAAVAYGLRWIGLSICFAVAAWIALRSGMKAWSQRLDAAATPEALMTASEVVTLAAVIIMGLVWMSFFSKERVRQAAFCLYPNIL